MEWQIFKGSGCELEGEIFKEILTLENSLIYKIVNESEQVCLNMANFLFIHVDIWILPTHADEFES